MVTAFKISQSLTRSVLSAGLLSAALSISPAIAGDDGGAVRLIGTVAIPATLKPLHGFDISWIDAQTQRYYLADRSNAAIDVVDAKTGTFLKAILGGFAGIAFNANGTANNAASGPHGVVTAGRWLFATDAAGRVVSIDLNTDTVVSTVFTSIAPGTLRADELAYDPVGGTLLVVNNADTPPFATLIKVNKSTGVLTLGQRITFGTGVGQAGINASNGAEQPVWDEQSKKFYLSIPEVCPVGGPLCGGNDPNGAVVRISPSSTGGLEAVYPVKYCQPAGLTLGPKQDLLIGCSVVFDTVGNVWSAADPNTAAPISVIMDAKNGSIDSVVAGVSGSDSEHPSFSAAGLSRSRCAKAGSRSRRQDYRLYGSFRR